MIRKLLLGLLLAMPGIAHAEWYEASGKHFVVYSPQSPKTTTAFTEQLERYDAAMRVMRGLDDPPIDPVNRVTVYIVPDTSVIRRIGGSEARGVYTDHVHPAAFVPRVTEAGHIWDLDGGSVLRHEYAHHFMFSTFGDTALPLWLVEGYAEFNAAAIFNPDGSVTFGQMPGYRALGLLRGPSLSLRAMFSADSRQLDPEHTDVLYGKGWLLVHYLAFDKARSEQLGAYVTAMHHGKSPLEAASVFGDLGRLDRDLSKTLDASRITVLTVPAAKLKIGAVALRPLTPGEAAIMPIRVQSKAGVTRALASQLVIQARKAAAPYPDDPKVQIALAEAEYDSGNYALCDAAAARALAADPKAVPAHVYQGMAAAAVARQAGATDAKTWAGVRKHFIIANHLDPDDPQPLALFYDSFASGETPTANALNGLRRALVLAPFDVAIRWQLAFAEMRERDWPAVRDTILPLAYAPHPDAKTRSAAELVAAIDAGDAAAITAKATALQAEQAKENTAG